MHTFYAKTDKRKRHKGISSFIVEKDFPALSYEKKEKKMGYSGSPTREIILDNCRVPAGNLFGSEGGAFFMIMAALDGGRITIGAMAVGTAQAAFDTALLYAQERGQFSKPIVQFQGIQWKLADMAMNIEAT